MDRLLHTGERYNHVCVPLTLTKGRGIKQSNGQKDMCCGKYLAALCSHCHCPGVAMKGNTHRVSNTDCHSPRQTWLRPLLNALYTSSRDEHRFPNTVPFPGIISLQLGGRLMILDHIHHKNQLFLLTGIDTYSRHEFSSCACNASSQTTICELTEGFIHNDVFCIALLLPKECISQPKK